MIDFAGALNGLFHRQASSLEERDRLHPRLCPVGYAAWQQYMRGLITEDAADRHKKPMPRVSDMARVGHNCLRFSALQWAGAPRSSTGTTAGLVRTWAIGSGMEVMAFRWLPLAIQEVLQHEVLECQYEGGMWPEGHQGDEPQFLSGHFDIRLVLRDTQGETSSYLLDLKSTSAGQQTKRTRNGVIVPEAEYQRQVGMYAASLGITNAVVLYWNKAWPSEFSQASVPPRAEVLKRCLDYSRRGKKMADSGELPPPTRGTYCAECKFVEACTAWESL